MTVYDRRGEGEEILHYLGPEHARLLAACRKPIGIAEVQSTVVDVASDRVPKLVDELDEIGLIFREGQRFVSLVLPDPKLCTKPPWWAAIPDPPRQPLTVLG